MSISLTRILQQITGLNTFFAGPSASRDNGVVLLDTATVTWGTDGQGNIQATASSAPFTLPTATASGQVLTATGAGTTYTAQALPVGSASQVGVVEVDGTSITAAAGVISVSPSQVPQLIQKITTTAESSITFSSIPQTFTHLRLVIVGTTTSGGKVNVGVKFNGDSGNNYDWQNLTGSVSTAAATFTQNTSSGLIASLDNGSACSVFDVTIGAYTSAFFKAATSKGSSIAQNSNVNVEQWGTLWHNTAAITSITLGAAFSAGCVVSLYGEP